MKIIWIWTRNFDCDYNNCIWIWLTLMWKGVLNIKVVENAKTRKLLLQHFSTFFSLSPSLFPIKQDFFFCLDVLLRIPFKIKNFFIIILLLQLQDTYTQRNAPQNISLFNGSPKCFMNQKVTALRLPCVQLLPHSYLALNCTVKVTHCIVIMSTSFHDIILQ